MREGEAYDLDSTLTGQYKEQEVHGFFHPGVHTCERGGSHQPVTGGLSGPRGTICEVQERSWMLGELETQRVGKVVTRVS